MALFGLALVTGLVVGRALNGRVDRLGDSGLRRLPLLLAAFLAQPATRAIVGQNNAEASARALVAGLALVGAWLVLTVRDPAPSLPLKIALGIVGVGWLLNTMVMAANGAMPDRDEFVLPDDATGGLIARHESVDDDTRLAFLGDVIPTPLGPTRLISLGDAAMAAGIAAVVAAGMRGRRDTPPAPQPATTPSIADGLLLRSDEGQ